MTENLPERKVRAAIYIRVSTDEQSKGYGPKVQEEKLRAFCKSQSEEYILNDESVYRDEGFSGSLGIDQRPELARLFEDAKQGKFEVVIVYRLDRFFRNTRRLLEALDILRAHNIAFQSATESFNTNEATGRLLITLLGGIAESERETIRERTMSGKLRAAREGKWVVGVPPYGYRVDENKKLYVIPAEAKIIRKLFQWAAVEKMPLREIEQKMNQLKVPPPYLTKYARKKTLGYWHRRTIGRLLTNEIFTGICYYRKYKRPFGNLTSLIDKRKLRPREEWIQLETPAIITRELFDATKDQLLENREFAKRNLKREYLYSKIIYCGVCGYKLFAGFQPPKRKWPGAGGRYYHGIYHNDLPPGTSKRCPWCPVYAEARLEPIWECLKEVLKNPRNMFDPLEKYIYREENPENIKDRLEEISTELSSVRERQSRVDELYISGQIDKNKYGEHSTSNGKEEKKLTDEGTRLRQSLLTKKEKAEREIAIQEAYEQIKGRLDIASYEEKIKIVRLFIERITLYAKEDYASVVFRFPGSTKTETVKLGKRVSQEDKEFPLVLNIKTMTIEERRQQIVSNYPLLYLPKTLV